MLIVILTLCSAMNSFAQSTQRSEDLRSIPGTWWFMAKLDNPVDTLLIMKVGDPQQTKVKTLPKDELGAFLFYTPLSEPCNYLVLTAPSNATDVFFSFNVHAEPGEVLAIKGNYDVGQPNYGLTFGGSRYYVDYAEAFMRLNEPPKEEISNDYDSVLFVINGNILPKSMNPQLLKYMPRHYSSESDLWNALKPFFLGRGQYIENIQLLIDVAATAVYGSIGGWGAIEITTRPMNSATLVPPKVEEAPITHHPIESP